MHSGKLHAAIVHHNDDDDVYVLLCSPLLYTSLPEYILFFSIYIYSYILTSAQSMSLVWFLFFHLPIHLCNSFVNFLRALLERAWEQKLLNKRLLYCNCCLLLYRLYIDKSPPARATGLYRHIHQSHTSYIPPILFFKSRFILRQTRTSTSLASKPHQSAWHRHRRLF